MDLDKYINDNIDEIIENSKNFLIDKTSVNNKIDIINNKNSNNIDINYEDEDEDEYEDEDEDDYNNQNLVEKEPNEDDYSEDIISELYQNMYESSNINSNIKTNVIDIFKNIKQNDLQKLDCDIFISNNTKINNNENEFLNDDGYYFFHLINIFTKYFNNKFNKNEHFFSDIKNLNSDTSNQMELFFDSIIEFKLLKETLKLDNNDCFKIIYSESESEKILEIFSNWNNQIYMFEFDNKKIISPSLLVILNYIYENNIINNDWNIYNLRNV